MKYLQNIKAELEAPRDQRLFGSGWISGSLGILAGVGGFGLGQQPRDLDGDDADKPFFERVKDLFGS